jgi:DNA-binding NarL/FixJ family response regulator
MTNTLRDGGNDLLLVDDHQFVRMALRALLLDLPTVNKVDEASSLDKAIRLASGVGYGLVLLDLDLPDSAGLDSYATFSSACPDTRVAIVSGDQAPDTMARSLRQGARGFITKTQPPAVIKAAVALMLAGERFVPSALYFHEIQSAAEGAAASERCLPSTDLPAPDFGELEEILSPRLREVLKLIVDGKSNKEISLALNLAPGTVKNYVSMLFERLDQPNRQHTIRYVTRLQSARSFVDGAGER